MRKARKQNGSLYMDKNGSKTPVWMFSWWHVLPTGQRVRRKRQIGTLEQYRTEAAAERAVRSWRLAINSNQAHAFSGITMKDVIGHFRLKELVDKGEDGRAWSTRNRYASYLDCWIEPRWGGEQLTAIKTPMVEEWLQQLRPQDHRRKKNTTEFVGHEKSTKLLAPASKAKIRNLMSVLFNHAIRWEFTDRNPIRGLTRGSGVRQSSKREKVPDILEVSELKAILAELQLRERVLLFLDMVTGLRRGELAGLKWQDVDYENLQIDVNKSVVNQVVGRCKTEASQKPVPMDEYTARDLLSWYRETPYRNPDDWVFASNSGRAGKKRGKQPLWLQTIMRYHVQPVVKRLGINKRVSWHTFRRTYATLLKANGEDVKVVQELLRHGSTRVTLDIYAQAQMSAKRAAQQKVVEMVRAKALPSAVEKGA
ncbi:MAG: tyrosine-type recombinase/integrase [Acidobacteriaceae bacterium]